MRNDAYTKVVLTSIVLCLLLIVAQRSTGWKGIERVEAASSARQQWEYKRLAVVQLDWHYNNLGTPSIAKSGDWYEDGVKMSGDLDATKKLTELGQEGWELVAVVPLAALWEDGRAGNQVVPLTSRVSFYFRRPKL
jgi:hypothetical protein